MRINCYMLVFELCVCVYYVGGVGVLFSLFFRWEILRFKMTLVITEGL